MSQLRIVIEVRSTDSLQLHQHFHLEATPIFADAAARRVLQAALAQLDLARLSYVYSDTHTLCEICYPAPAEAPHDHR